MHQSQEPERILIEQGKAARGSSADFLNALTQANDRQLVNHALRALRRGPVRYHRNNVIVCEGDPTDYMFLVVSGTVRTCRTYETGTRSIIAFYVPGDLLGWTDAAKHSLSVEAATDAIILFLKRNVLLSVASQERGFAKNFTCRHNK